MKRKGLTLTLILGFTAVLVVFGVADWHHRQIHPSTENAYIGGDVTTVAARVPGTLLRVAVRDHAPVRAGNVIATIDPRDYDESVNRARAGVTKARATLALQRARIAGARAQLDAARARDALARADRKRFHNLSEKGSTAQRQYDQAVAAERVARAQTTAAQKALAAEQAALAVSTASVEKARTGLASAQLQRSYCTVSAPCDGIIADRSAHPGQVVGAGQPLCRIVQLEKGHVWVSANFKETQLRRIRVGQPATVKIDAGTGNAYRAHVASFGAGTGAAFSLLPPENATGNWVKVVQRLPVRIVFDEPVPPHTLRIGLSCRVTVDTRNNSRAGDAPQRRAEN